MRHVCTARARNGRAWSHDLNLKIGALTISKKMSSLRVVNSMDSSRATATKRRLPSYGEEKASKENHPTPAVPKRTKRQNLAGKTPPTKVSI